MSHVPVIVGVAQITARERGQDAVALLAQCARAALADAQAADADALLEAIDSIALVNTGSIELDDGNYKMPAMLADALGAACRPVRLEYLGGAGGDSPQILVNRACAALEGGEIRAALLGGVEVCNTTRVIQSSAKGIDISELQLDYEGGQPVRMYALIETALRSRAGRTPHEHALHMGRLFSRFAHVASENPDAWTQRAFTPEEIALPAPDNRMTAFPYTRRLCAHAYVDMSAAVLLTTAATAVELGIPRDKWVYPLGGANLHDVHAVEERLALDESPAIRTCARLALEQASVALADVAFFDLYSCFPSAVQIGMREIGLCEDDPRPLTVTGGLPFFGAPLNNYVMHAIVTTARRLRSAPTSTTALVWGNGYYVTKHAVGVYGREPRAHRAASFREMQARLVPLQEAIFASRLPPAVRALPTDVPARVEAFWIVHDGPGGSPSAGVALVRAVIAGPLQRSFARLDHTSAELAALESLELVGRIGRVRHDAASALNWLRLATDVHKL